MEAGEETMQEVAWSKSEAVALVDDIVDVGWISETEYQNAIELIGEGKVANGVEYALKQAGLE